AVPLPGCSGAAAVAVAAAPELSGLMLDVCFATSHAATPTSSTARPTRRRTMTDAWFPTSRRISLPALFDRRRPRRLEEAYTTRVGRCSCSPIHTLARRASSSTVHDGHDGAGSGWAGVRSWQRATLEPAQRRETAMVRIMR